MKKKRNDYEFSRHQNKKKLIIGLTGGFGAGKSTVAGIFKSLGADVIDADKIAHELMRPKQSVCQKITSVFGKKILKGGAIDRFRLGEIVFSDSRLLKKLNSIIHPQIIRIIRKKIKQSHFRLIVLDAPLLVESGLNKIADALIVVKASRNRQIERIQKRAFLSRQDVLRRIKCQIPLRMKLSLADFIIDNNGPIKETKRQVGEIWRKIWKSWTSRI